MKILRAALLLVHAFALSRFVGSASIDKHEIEKSRLTAVINLLHAESERSAEDSVDVAYHHSDEYNYDNEDEYDDYSSGNDEAELPRVAFSQKPKDPTAVLTSEGSEGKKRRGRKKGKGKRKGKGKGKGKKEDPCLGEFKSFCIHGTCHYLKELSVPSCICLAGYTGERCHSFSLPVGKDEEGYDRTTALAVMAVVLSSLCLTVIVILLALRYHRRGAYDVENEEKVKLGAAPHH